MHPRALAIADFTYALPEDRIAQEPLANRESSKLLVVDHGRLRDRRFRELPALLPAGSLLVLNDTRVVNARLVLHRSTGARIEVLCLASADGRAMEAALSDHGTSVWQCFIGNAKRWANGEELELASDEVVLRARRSGTEQVAFSWSPERLSFGDVLARLGHVPLPPYMKRPDREDDRERYNTVFGHHDGSVAAPTASLHFSPALLDDLDARGVRTVPLTLHVGAGTFLPVKSLHMEGHTMHHEQVHVPLRTIQALAGQLGKGPVVAVGTTALRTLESLYWHGVQLIQGGARQEMDVAQWEPYGDPGAEIGAFEALAAVANDLQARGQDHITGRTQLLIAPGYRFRLVDGLITNFHQPQSTLLLLVAAFLGPAWRTVYEHALVNGYRFLSYGDASLLWRIR